MTINIQKFNEVAKAAKAKTNDKRWQAAIDKAVAGVTSGWWVITELFDGVMATTECGQTYHANGSCQCRAFELGQPCKHRALARLLDLYHEVETASVVSRASLIADIKAAWPKDINLADELLRRFRVNYLEALADDMLRGVLAACA
jgi:hypothetical protein